MVAHPGLVDRGVEDSAGSESRPTSARCLHAAAPAVVSRRLFESLTTELSRAIESPRPLRRPIGPSPCGTA